MSDLPTLVDISGRRPDGTDPLRLKGVRLIADGTVQDVPMWKVYGERNRHQGTDVDGADGIVFVGVILGQLVADERRPNRWTLDGYKVSKTSVCPCNNRGAALKAWTP